MFSSLRRTCQYASLQKHFIQPFLIKLSSQIIFYYLYYSASTLAQSKIEFTAHLIKISTQIGENICGPFRDKHLIQYFSRCDVFITIRLTPKKSRTELFLLKWRLTCFSEVPNLRRIYQYASVGRFFQSGVIHPF